MRPAAFDRLELDRLIARDHDRVFRFRSALARGELPPLPTLSPRTSRLAARDELRELDQDELGARLTQHVAALTSSRVTLGDELELARARSAQPSHAGARSVRAALGALLDHESNREATFRSLLEVASRTQDAARRLFARRAEAARRLGAGSHWELLGPPRERVVAAIASLRPALEALDPSPPPLFDLPLAALARQAGEGFPAALTMAWLRGLFAGSDLVRGLALPRLALRSARGAASFVHALREFGESVAHADREQAAAYVLLRDPDHALRTERGVLFASLLYDPVFLRRRLGLGRDRAQVQARHMAAALCAELRLLTAGATVELAFERERPPRAIVTEVEELLGRPPPLGALGVLPPVPGAAARLCAIEPALATRARLIEEFDEDWFDNPRAAESLRHEHRTPRTPEPPGEPRLGQLLGAILG